MTGVASSVALLWRIPWRGHRISAVSPSAGIILKPTLESVPTAVPRFPSDLVRRLLTMRSAKAVGSFSMREVGNASNVVLMDESDD